MRKFFYVFKSIYRIILRSALILRLIFKKKIRVILSLSAIRAYSEAALILFYFKLHRARPLLPKPIIFLGLSSKCNLRCIFCLAYSPLIVSEEEKKSANTWQFGRDVSGRDTYLDFEKFKQLIDDLCYLNPAAINLSGNDEILLYPKLIETITYIKQKPEFRNLNIKFSTNGILLDRNLSQRLLDAGINDINFSINSASPLTYKIMHCADEAMFHVVLRNVKDFTESAKFRAKTPTTTASFVLCKKNFEEIIDMVNLCGSLGVRRAGFRFMYYCKAKNEQLRDFLLDSSEKKKLRELIFIALLEAKKIGVITNLPSLLNILNTGSKSCFFPNRSHAYYCQIHANGMVNPYDFPYLMGNVTKESIVDIWYSSKYFIFRNWIEKKAIRKESIPNVPFCFRCNYSKCEKDNNCCIIF